MLANSKPSKALALFLKTNSVTLSAILSSEVVLVTRHFTKEHSVVYVAKLIEMKGYKTKRWKLLHEISPLLKDWWVEFTVIDNPLGGSKK